MDLNLNIETAQLLEHLQAVVDELRQRLAPAPGGTRSGRELGLLTPTGKVRNLHEKIVNELRRREAGASSQDLAGCLYDARFGISRDAFLRRVVVAASYLSKQTPARIELAKLPGGKTQWRLSSEKAMRIGAYDLEAAETVSRGNRTKKSKKLQPAE